MEPAATPRKPATNPGLVRNFDKKPRGSDFFVKNAITIFVGLVLLGLATGAAVAKFNERPATNASTGASTLTLDGKEVTKGMTVGSEDTKTFKDTAEGTLVEGGIEGEGAYHLERPGGESQNVYLTSSVVDLSPFVDRKIKVWGKTFAGEKAGWLMDVGRVEVLE